MAAASEMAAKGRTATSHGAYVGRVASGSVAASAGLLVGDVIVSIGGQPVADAAQLEQAIASVSAGQSVALEYLRGTKQRDTVLRF